MVMRVEWKRAVVTVAWDTDRGSTVCMAKNAVDVVR